MTLSTSIRSWFFRPLRWVKTVFSLKRGLIFVLVVLFSTFVAVMFYETVEKCVGQLLGLGLSEENEKNKILTFLGIGMGGILLALQAVIANKRAQAMENAANAQAEANRNTEQGQRQERFKNAIEHLGHKSVSVRLGGAYELFHLAEDTEDEDTSFRQTILDILCAHIRQTTGDAEYQEKHMRKPSEEVQSLLTLLFIQDHNVFEFLHINLQGSWLNGADLDKADLRLADLSRAHLQESSLDEAYLHGALLLEARMEGARLVRAHLHGTILYGVQLQGANLGRARLPGAVLFEAQLQGVNLGGAHLQGALLGGAKLQGAHLTDAEMRGVRCEEDISGSYEQRMRQLIGQKSDLSWITFAGGLSQNDVEVLTRDLSDEKTNELREELTSHIGIPESNELPQDSGAITGAYTEEEAEEWIAEFEKGMWEGREGDDPELDDM